MEHEEHPRPRKGARRWKPRGERPGGKSCSHRESGFTLELGPTGFLGPDEVVDEAWRSVGLGADRLEARGNVYLFEGRIQDRFDSIVVDMELIGDLGRGPDDCVLEPRGYIGLRDTNAYWHDLVFLPRYEDDLTNNGFPNEPLSVCDGCGTLYIRGVKTVDVCVDFSSVFSGGLIRPPIEDFVQSLHDLP